MDSPVAYGVTRIHESELIYSGLVISSGRLSGISRAGRFGLFLRTL